MKTIPYGTYHRQKKIAKTIDDLPEQTTVEEAIERLMLLHKIEVGLRQSEEGEGMRQSEVEDHFHRRREARKSE